MNARAARLVLFVLLLGVTAAPVFSQSNPNEEQGLKPYDSWHGGDLDSVSMTSGALSLEIPLVSLPQRGNLDLSFMVRFSNKQWKRVVPPRGNPLWLPAANSGTQVVSSVDSWLQYSETDDSDTGTVVNWATSLTSPDGNSHMLGTGGSSTPVYPMRSLDATGLLYPNSQLVIMSDGTRYNYPNFTGQKTDSNAAGFAGVAGVQASSIVDANGNQITINSTGANIGWIDTLGRWIPGTPNSSFPIVQPGVATPDLSTCPAGTASAALLSVPGTGGSTRAFKLCYSNISLSTGFTNGTNFIGSASALTAVVRPDLTMWTFSYDNYGNVTQINFPTGGSISYTYDFGPTTCLSAKTSQSRWVTSRTVSDGHTSHTWHYNYSGQITTVLNSSGGSTSNYSGTTTVTDPDGNQTVHTVKNPVLNRECSIYVTQTQYFQGSQSTGTLLKTTQTQYTGFAPSAGMNGLIAISVTPSQQSTILPGGQTATEVATYDPATADGNGNKVLVGSVLRKDEYDFSGTVARSTVNSYLWQSSAIYKNNNLVGLIGSTTVKDGAGNQVAQTTYGYDESQPASAGVTTQWAAPAGGNLGNPTSVRRWLNTSTTPVTRAATYFDTGMKASSTDPLGHVTQYSYSANFAGAYPTRTQAPDTGTVHHIVKGNYDFGTGLLTSFTGENGEVYTYQYDNMLRMTQATHPDLGQTKFFYPNPNLVERQRSIDASRSDDYFAAFDGLGRTIQTRQITPACTILTDTVYDARGHVASVSNPYCSTSDPTYGVTQYQYDALSRGTRTVKQDGSASTVEYSDNCTTATDESGRQRRACTDAFGRLVEVDEPNPGAVATPATGWVSISGSEQTTTGAIAITVANSGFEAPAVGAGGYQYNPAGGSWTFSGGTGVSSNGSPFTSGNPAAPEGTQVAFIQGGSTSVISQALSGFQAGATYTVKFYAAQRGNASNGGQDFDVYLDSNLLGTFRPGSTNYGALATAAFTTTAGTHTLKFVGRDSSGGDNTAFIDAVQVTGTIGIADTGTVTVSINGTPYSYNYGATDNAGTIALGLTNAINAGSLVKATSNANSDVAVANSGFETPAVGAGQFQYNPTGGSWVFSGQTGISSNGSAFTSGNPAAPEGTQVAFVQNGPASVISQSLSGFQTGVSYTVRFYAAQRGNFANGGQDFDVYLDSTLLGTFRPGSTSYGALATAAFTTTTGAHTLKFVGRDSSGGDNTAFIDAVRVTAAGGNTINLTSNATGSAANYSLTTSTTWNNSQFTQPSFAASPSGATLTGGTDAGGLNSNPLVTTYQYNALGDLLNVNQQGDGTAPRLRSFTYDSLGRLLTANNPESGTTQYSYDAGGHLLAKTDARGVTVNYGYDALNRPTEKDYPSLLPPGSKAPILFTVTYTYDEGANGIGRRTSMSDPSGSSSWTYDNMGRTLSAQLTVGTVTKSMGFSYYLNGAPQTITYPSGFVLTYTVDSASRPVSAVDTTNGLNYVTGASYSPVALTGFTSGASATFAGIKSTFTLNPRLQPITIQADAPGGTLFSLTYDFHLGKGNNGNVWQVINNLDNARNQSFTYDQLDRLTSAQTAGTDCTQINADGSTKFWGNSYSFDPWGNLLAKSVTKCSSSPLSVSVDSNNRIVGYCYDAAGNLLGPGSCSAPLYAYDAENRITGAGGFTYTYDGDGARVMKSNGSTGTLYFGNLAETDLAGNINSEYIFLNDTRVARRDGNGAVFYYFSDRLKSTAMVTDVAGNIKSQSEYQPWGEERQVVNQDSNHFKFTGKERDSESGLNYFGARYYAATMGRFTSPDNGSDQHPQDPRSWNLYSYARNNPEKFVDPSGNYVCGSSMTPAQCKEFGAKLADAQRIANKIARQSGLSSPEWVEAQRAIDAYGKAGVDNGVTIQIGNVPAGAVAETTDVTSGATQRSATNPNGVDIVVTLKPGFLEGANADAQAIDIAHEGSHVADYSELEAGEMPGNSMTSYQTEFRAYGVTASMLNATGPQSGPFFVYASRNGQRILFWGRTFNDAANTALRDYMIKQLYPNWPTVDFQDNTHFIDSLTGFPH